MKNKKHINRFNESTENNDSNIKSMSEERIKVLKAEIAERELEIKDLTKKMISEETDFHKQFRLWANNSLDKKCQSYLPSGDLRKWVDENLDLGAMRGVIQLLDYEESFGLFMMSDEEIEEYSLMEELNELKQDTVFINACKQMMRDNIDSFQIDW